jgi:predicted transcriptional regulator
MSFCLTLVTNKLHNKCQVILDIYGNGISLTESLVLYNAKGSSSMMIQLYFSIFNRQINRV